MPLAATIRIPCFCIGAAGSADDKRGKEDQAGRILKPTFSKNVALSMRTLGVQLVY